MKLERLQLALDRLTFSDWRRLELFASEFLVSEFSDLRTTASASGDGGRDAEIFSFADNSAHVLQYSVTPKWQSKIRQTVERLKATNPDFRILTYATNVQIGADADELKAELRRTEKVFLDVRDKSYFLERFRSSPGTEKAAEALAVDLVDPLLVEAQIIKRSAAVLTSEEAKAALLLLSLQLKDDTQEKGLTKLSFDALVRSALADTDADHRLTRDEIIKRVREVIPHESPSRVDRLTISALERLRKRVIRHYLKGDEYCLTHEEAQKVVVYRKEQELREVELHMQIERLVSIVAQTEDANEIKSLAVRSRRTLEKVLYTRAELFAATVLAGDMGSFASIRLREIVLSDQTQHAAIKGAAEADPALIETIIREVLISETSQIREYLLDLANAYTLMAFLRITPDVQNAIRKIFSYGEIFLDTTVLLPILAEQLLNDGKGEFENIIRTATEAGIEFFVTEGVLEELSSHLKRGLAYARGNYQIWEGDIPFIFEAYIRAGSNQTSFPAWVEEFMGDVQPIDDLAIYLHRRLGVNKASLESYVDSADVELRQAIDQIWYAIHEGRREKDSKRGTFDPLNILRLAKHDTENYVGVIQKRKRENDSLLGYSAWWLTFDRQALAVPDLLKSKHGISPPPSPVISIDFLAQSLAIGSIRTKVSKESAQTLPLMIEPRNIAFLTKELLDEAQSIRKSMEGKSEHVIARKVRDHLNFARQKMGPMALKGVEHFYDQLSNEL